MRPATCLEEPRKAPGAPLPAPRAPGEPHLPGRPQTGCLRELARSPSPPAVPAPPRPPPQSPGPLRSRLPSGSGSPRRRAVSPPPQPPKPETLGGVAPQARFSPSRALAGPESGSAEVAGARRYSQPPRSRSLRRTPGPDHLRRGRGGPGRARPGKLGPTRPTVGAKTAGVLSSPSCSSRSPREALAWGWGLPESQVAAGPPASPSGAAQALVGHHIRPRRGGGCRSFRFRAPVLPLGPSSPPPLGLSGPPCPASPAHCPGVCPGVPPRRAPRPRL